MSKFRMGLVVVAVVFSIVAALAFGPLSISNAASTTKALSTNYTLVNLGPAVANVAVQYLLDNGSAWTAPASSTTFTISANGGQKIVRQYQDAMTPSSGRGSAVISSDQPLGAVVQMLAVGQTPTSGAYSGISQGSSKYYVPLALRRLNGASGLGNSQIMVQNTGTSAVTVNIALIGTTNFTKSGVSIPAGSTYYYDLDDETNLPAGWFGSVVASVVSPVDGKIAVVSNLFTGPDAVQTFNGFSQESVGKGWLVPLFTSRLTNGLSTPIAIQNLSGGSIAAGGISVACTKDSASPAPATFTTHNTAAVANNASFNVNPVTDLTLPAAWFGSCRVTSTGNVVAFVQMRNTTVGATVPVNTSNAAAYEAINASGTDTKMFIPLAAKRLGNGFATAVTIQNLSSTNAANVTLTYTPSPDYVASGGSAAVLSATNVSIPAGTSIIQNQRLATFTVGSTAMPDGWYGTLTVSATGAPINGFVQLTNYLNPAGDTFMAHDGFTQP